MTAAPAAVTVIMPAYNMADYIAESIRSVQAQTFPDWELVVVDDGSTDRTLAIVEDIARRDPRVRPMGLASNSGNRPAVPRNHGLGAARGRYIAFLDSDDSWHPEKLGRQVAILDADPDTQLVYVLFSVRLADGTLRGPYPAARRRPRGHAFGQLYVHPVVSNSAVMLRRAVLDRVGPLDENPRLVEDQDLWLRIARVGPIDYVDGEPLLTYRQRATSHSSGNLRPWLRMMAVLRKHAGDAGIRLFLFAVLRQSLPFLPRIAAGFAQRARRPA